MVGGSINVNGVVHRGLRDCKDVNGDTHYNGNRISSTTLEGIRLMFHQPIQEQHSVKNGTKFGVLKVFVNADMAQHMMRELPEGSVRCDRTVWVPYPDVVHVIREALTYQVDSP